MEDQGDRSAFSPEQAHDHFLRLLGRLHHAYTAVEHELGIAVYVAVTRLGERDDVIVAMLGEQRVSPLKDTVKRLLRVTDANLARMDYVNRIFHHLGEIQFFRNRLTHYLTVMSDYDPECWVNMNFIGIKERVKMEDIHFNLYALYAAAVDLEDMRSLIGEIFNYRVEGRSTDLPDVPTWEYNPSMLVRKYPVLEGMQKQKL